MNGAGKIYARCNLKFRNVVYCGTDWLFSSRVLHKEHFVPYYFQIIY
jgi:hypothetical protein